jgi:predicted transcriptional regulator
LLWHSQILETGREELEGVTKTRIMYKSFLSYGQLKDYLAVLTKSELLEHLEERNTYRTTDKGIKILQACQKVNGKIGDEIQP